MIDRQFLVSPERTPTLGTVTRATDSSFNCEVSFRGRSYECKSAGKNALAVGDSVSFVQIDQTPWVIKSDALYPTRFKRPLTDWAGHHKFNLLLQYLISRGARKNYTFQTGTAQGVVSTNVLSVNCWDGRTRSLLVEYAGVLRPASDFVVGDQVLVYQKTPQNWAVVGMASLPRINARESIYFPTTSVGSESVYPDILVPENLTSPVIITTASPFSLSTDGVTYSDSITLPKTGGTFYTKFAPTFLGTFTHSIAFASTGAANDSTALYGVCSPVAQSLNMVIHCGAARDLYSMWAVGSNILTITTPSVSAQQNNFWVDYYEPFPIPGNPFPPNPPHDSSPTVSLTIDQITGTAVKLVLQAWTLNPDGSFSKLGSETEYIPTATPGSVFKSESLPSYRDSTYSWEPKPTVSFYKGYIALQILPN